MKKLKRCQELFSTQLHAPLFYSICFYVHIMHIYIQVKKSSLCIEFCREHNFMHKIVLNFHTAAFSCDASSSKRTSKYCILYYIKFYTKLSQGISHSQQYSIDSSSHAGITTMHKISKLKF